MDPSAPACLAPSARHWVMHAKHLLMSKISVPSDMVERRLLSMSTQICLSLLTTAAILPRMSAMFFGPMPPAYPYSTDAGGAASSSAHLPVPHEASNSTLTLPGSDAGSRRSWPKSGSVSSFICRIHSTSGTAANAARSAGALSARRLVSTPLILVAFTCTRPKPLDARDRTNAASPSSTSFTRRPQRWAARRMLAPPLCRSAFASASRSMQPGVG
mmetsp:Transcript_108647/g.307251  ORF Transcript_108647/g.307251 Transcript_108647/m.307251 type:complete len:216 (+) Transcript_108647:152-799(+)